MSRSLRQADQPMTFGNWAESLLELGRRIRRPVRQGTGIEDVSQEFHVDRDYCQLALEFVSSSDLLKLRALVEDWPLERIAEQLGGPVRPSKSLHHRSNDEFRFPSQRTYGGPSTEQGPVF